MDLLDALDPTFGQHYFEVTLGDGRQGQVFVADRDQDVQVLAVYEEQLRLLVQELLEVQNVLLVLDHNVLDRVFLLQNPDIFVRLDVVLILAAGNCEEGYLFRELIARLNIFIPDRQDFRLFWEVFLQIFNCQSTLFLLQNFHLRSKKIHENLQIII